MLIKGDCRKEVPKLIKNFKNKIQCILIDPPYNTKIDYVRYKDSWTESKWISMMKSLLSKSYQLLNPNGVMYICIDENEYVQLKLVCIKIFGEDNVKTLIWKKVNKLFDKNRIEKNYKNIRVTHEYILMCFKNFNKTTLNKIYQPEYVKGKWIQKQTDLESILDNMGTTSSAKDEIAEMFGKRESFSTPKPTKLFKELIRACTNKHSIVLDYFAGSGTTGQATIELNKEDKGERQYILISNDEGGTFDSVLKGRIEYAGSK